MYRIAKRFDFSASHQLTHLPPAHQCARLHGHNYSLELVFESTGLDQRGFIVDYGELDVVKEVIHQRFEHRHLNDVLEGPEATTAENLAFLFYMTFKPQFPALTAARVSETGKTWAEYRQASVS